MVCVIGIRLHVRFEQESVIRIHIQHWGILVPSNIGIRFQENAIFIFDIFYNKLNSKNSLKCCLSDLKKAFDKQPKKYANNVNKSSTQPKLITTLNLNQYRIIIYMNFGYYRFSWVIYKKSSVNLCSSYYVKWAKTSWTDNKL